MKLKRDELRDARRIKVRQKTALMPAAKALLQFGDGWFPIPFAFRADELRAGRDSSAACGELVSAIPLRKERGIYAASMPDGNEILENFERTVYADLEAA